MQFVCRFMRVAFDRGWAHSSSQPNLSIRPINHTWRSRSSPERAIFSGLQINRLGVSFWIGMIRYCCVNRALKPREKVVMIWGLRTDLVGFLPALSLWDGGRSIFRRVLLLISSVLLAAWTNPRKECSEGLILTSRYHIAEDRSCSIQNNPHAGLHQTSMEAYSKEPLLN